MVKTSTSRWKNLLLLLSSLFFLALAAEGILRLLGMANPIVYDTNSVFGYEPKPNQSSERLGVPIFINDVGLRDDEDYNSMRGKKKILIIGDSVTYGGSRTRQEDLFTEVLEDKLARENLNIKVLNAGVNGYSVFQMFRRAERLLPIIEPDLLIVYTIRRDFFRPPVTFISEGNVIYPTSKPQSALFEFLVLSMNHLNKRYNFFGNLPSAVVSWLKPPMNFAPPFEQSKVVDLNFNAVQSFLENAWDPSGQSREQIMIFVAPERGDLEDKIFNQNGDIRERFDLFGIECYDLRKDFFEAIVAKGRKIEDYYWDDMHYIERGHSLAAEILANYILSVKNNLTSEISLEKSP